MSIYFSYFYLIKALKKTNYNFTKNFVRNIDIFYRFDRMKIALKKLKKIVNKSIIMNIETTLKNIGLEQKEREVYLKLLEMGQTTMTELAKSSQIKRPTAYLVVQELQLKGLVSETLMGKRKQYSATHPKRLLEMAQDQKRQIEETLPDLLALYNQPKNKPRIQVFENKMGLRLVYKDMFNAVAKGEEALFFADVEAIHKVVPEIMDEFKQAVSKLKSIHIRELHYQNKAAKHWAEHFKREYKKGYQIRYLPNTYEFGMCDNVIYGNKLVIFSLKGDLFVIVIESEEIAKTYRAMFEWAWQMGK